MSNLPGLPPRERLVQLVRSLGKHLPAQLAPLIAAKRFTDGTSALARLADDAHLSAALALLADSEAAWLAERIEARWRAVAEPVLDPIAAIVAPPELWIGREPIRVPLAVAVVGAEPDWEVVWDNATSTTAGHAVAIAEPDAHVLAVRVHVRARTAIGRMSLSAAARIALRRPTVTVREDRRRIVVADQHGAPGIGVSLTIGDAPYVTGPGGLVELGQPASPGATMRVQGIPAGRIPEKT